MNYATMFDFSLLFREAHEEGVRGVLGGSETSNVHYVLETVALTKRQEAEMEVAELKMLRCSIGVTRMDTIRNE